MRVGQIISETKESFTAEAKCPRCGSIYIVVGMPQTPGYRDYGEEICPVCGNVNRRSLDYDFETYKTKKADGDEKK